MKPWKLLSSQYALETPWFNIRADRCELAPGKVIEPFYVMETFDWVHVVALTPDRQILLVRQYRHGSQVILEELPGGLRDKGQTPLETAQRELLEEVGGTAKKWVSLASTYPDPARMNNRLHTFLALDVEITAKQSLDFEEEIHVHTAPFAQVEARIASGAFAQSTQIASYFLAKRYLEATTNA